MSIGRQRLGVGILDDNIYAVGGDDNTTALNSVEVFDVVDQNWRMVTSMTDKRYDFGIGALNNRLYAVGGVNCDVLKSVEYYDSTLNTWTLVADMSKYRQGVAVGVMDGIMYAIGGYDGSIYLKSVECYRPSCGDGKWSFIPDMHLP
ncbi:kelch-like protein 3 [Acyrthosiphon pisum]|uniref:Uncharacterized protein n=1 Tax=Acyrthosiphon pisum TaxID=7029 RepID=A0A8R2B003_ACYPI|nr:kelch-like protein 3 [Acyrthosiphon pisum]|eukprot:XP_008180695.1 PREDICTED: kelch-like protein 3 [Acyrthosiphon pisum]